MRGRWGKVARRVGWPTLRSRRWVALGLGVAVVSLLLAVFLTRGLGIIHLRRDLVRLEVAAREAGAEQTSLRAKLASSSHAKVMEDQAREKLGLIKSGEEKVIFVEE